MSEVPAHDDISRAQPRLPFRNVPYQPPEVPMGCRRVVFGCLGVLVAWSAAGPAPGQTAAAVPPWGPAEPPPAFGPAPVALEEVSPAARARVRAVIEQPTLASHGPTESFNCQPSLYAWLLDHPDQAVRLWRRLGAKCLDIEDHGSGHFGYRDAQGSDVRWETVVRTPGQRVW